MIKSISIPEVQRNSLEYQKVKFAEIKRVLIAYKAISQS